MGTLSWGEVLQPTFPNFKLLYAKNALAVQTTIFLYGKTASLSLKNRNIWDLATFWWIAWSGSWFWPRQGECNQACHIRHHQALLRHCPPSISAVLGTERTGRSPKAQPPSHSGFQLLTHIWPPWDLRHWHHHLGGRQRHIYDDICQGKHYSPVSMNHQRTAHYQPDQPSSSFDA